MIKGVTHTHLDIIQNLLMSPIHQTSFLVWTFFAISYSKLALASISYNFNNIFLLIIPLQPTSSTSKIAAGKTQNGIYSRHRRPKSCKYDTYRLRSRHSQVEENLFGEPLKNKLMARSRSMEAISQGDNSPPPSEPTLYDRRVTDQRPKHLCPRLSIMKRSI